MQVYFGRVETPGCGGESLEVACPDTRRGMPVGVRVRDSFRSRIWIIREKIPGSSTTLPWKIHSWARNGRPSTGRLWATAGKGPARVPDTMADVEARVLKLQICIGLDQPWSARMSLPGLVAIERLLGGASGPSMTSARRYYPGLGIYRASIGSRVLRASVNQAEG